MSSTNDSTEIRQWYDEYMAAEGRQLTQTNSLVVAVQDDELDESLLEKRIEDLRSKTVVTGRFCNDCQALFDDWPDLSDSNTTAHPDGTKCFPGSGADWKHAVARTFQTLQLEAAARNGCVFCALLVQQMKDTQQLRTFLGVGLANDPSATWAWYVVTSPASRYRHTVREDTAYRRSHSTPKNARGPRGSSKDTAAALP